VKLDMETDLFHRAGEGEPKPVAPLADRMRPKSLDDFVGQEHLLGPGRLLRQMIESDRVPSLIMWGPPGSGKTTLARIIAARTKASFQSYSAVISGIKEMREVINQASVRLATSGRRTILFVDEIHRFNKAQQDVLLPHVESGLITFIGATTENPSFEVISPLLSRCRVIVLHALRPEELVKIIKRALSDPVNGLGKLNVVADDSVLEKLALMADGDARAALDSLELAVAATRPDGDGKRRLTLDHIEEALQKRAPLYDKHEESHFNLISALHKSLRGSDPQAGLYWLARMLVAGEDPMYIARRLVRFAAEDVGLADPQALPISLAARDSYHFLGSPEGELALAQAVVYLATAPKSNSLYTAWKETLKTARESGSLPVPYHIRNAPTRLMKAIGYGKDYKYDHDHQDAYAGQEFLPPELKSKKFYVPSQRGFEREIRKRMAFWEKRKAELAGTNSRKGKLIVFEGIDGCGKTTQAGLLAAELRRRKYRVLLLREPTNSAWGRKIQRLAVSGRDSISPREELELFVNDRRENVKRNILPALEDGKVVILDRYYFSTMAYQGARGLDPRQIRELNESFAPVPDLVILIDIPLELALKRIEENRRGGANLFERRESLEKVQAIFDSLLDDYIHRFDGTKNKQELAGEILGTVLSRLKPGGPTGGAGERNHDENRRE